MKKILIARSADADNFNAQAKNAQHILRHWTPSPIMPTAFAFGRVEEGVASNSNVEIIKLTNNRLWPLRVAAEYFRSWDAIVCPGMHHAADWAALRLREIFGQRIPVIATLEGLLGIEGDTGQERYLSQISGHPVFCQKVPRGIYQRRQSVLRSADHIIAISPFLEKVGRILYGDKLSMLPLGVDTSLFRRGAFVQKTRPRVVCAASMQPRKRVEYFIDLAARFPGADFVWYGEGERRTSLIRAACARGLANISFPGALSVEALSDAFRQADIFVLPSNSEGVPKVTQEAAACGLAQIIFGFYEAPTVVDGYNGYVVWSDDELVSRLDFLLQNPEKVRAMGLAGQKLASGWAWDVVAPRWQSHIIELVKVFGHIKKND